MADRPSPYSSKAALFDALMQTWPVKAAQDTLSGMRLAGDVYAGRVDPLSSEGIDRSMNLAGALTLGAGAVPKPRGALNMGARGLRQEGTLPADYASRANRANEMGIRMEMPVYHGTNQEITAFDPLAGVPTTSAAPAQNVAAWVSLDPETANEFALLASRGSGQNSQIYPLRHRASNPLVFELDGTETNLEVQGALADAFAAGHDAVMFKNYTTPGGKKGKTILAVKNANQLRSPHAMFDPAKKNSSDILAGVAGTAAGGLGLAGMGDDAQAATGGGPASKDTLNALERALMQGRKVL